MIRRWVANLNAAGLVAILDLHWSAPGSMLALRQWPMPDSDHSVTFWSEVARSFKDTPSVIFDLFNEPSLGKSDPTIDDWKCWRNGCSSSSTICSPTDYAICSPTGLYQVAGMQKLLDAVRNAGATQPVMIAGLRSATDVCIADGVMRARGQCPWIRFAPIDPDHQLVASFHTYDSTPCHSVGCWDSNLLPVADQVPIVTGELGESDCSSSYVKHYMEWADRHGISYLIWSWERSPPTTSCQTENFKLISNWNGATNSLNPVSNIPRRHLTELSRRQASV